MLARWHELSEGLLGFQPWQVPRPTPLEPAAWCGEIEHASGRAGQHRERGCRHLCTRHIRRRGPMAAQRASAADLTPVSVAAVAQLATAVGLPLCSAVACLCASSLRRSSSTASIFRPIHSSNAGLIISRTRCSIEASSVLVRFMVGHEIGPCQKIGPCEKTRLIGREVWGEMCGRFSQRGASTRLGAARFTLAWKFGTQRCL